MVHGADGAGTGAPGGDGPRAPGQPSPDRPLPDGPRPLPDEPRARPGGHRPLVALTATLTAALTAAVIAGAVVRDDPARGPATPASPVASGSSPTTTQSVQAAPVRPTAEDADTAVLRAILDGRATALLSRDRTAWLARLAGPARAEQKALFKRLRDVPFEAARFELEPGGLTETGGGPRTADVRFAYRLTGDARDVVRRWTWTVVGTGEGLQVTGITAADPDGAADLWDLTDVAVARSGAAVVVGAAGRRAALLRYAAEADAAAARVDAVWEEPWRRPVVVVVPGSVEQMARVLGRDGTAGLDQIAAVTTGEIDRPDGSGRPAATADRVVLNPDAFDAAGDPRVRRVVLTHELTHVATRGTVRVGPPLWLEEGFADWVAYQGTGLTREQVAGDLLARVRAGRGPDALPDVAAFDPRSHPVDDAYAGAWLALDAVGAREDDDAAVVDFYRTAAGLEDAPPGAAMTTQAALDRAYARLGTDAEGFRTRWLDHLADVAGAARP